MHTVWKKGMCILRSALTTNLLSFASPTALATNYVDFHEELYVYSRASEWEIRLVIGGFEFANVT